MNSTAITQSPFFAPHKKKKTSRPFPSSEDSNTNTSFASPPSESKEEEIKSSIAGAAFNLMNAIIGAGIVGIPYAIKECGFVWGVFMVVFCAFLTVKSLRLLIETAKYINVPSYEMLAEASLGRPGFFFVSIAMFVMAYGAMVSYLMIVKSTLPDLLGVDIDDAPTRRAVLTLTSFCIMLPLSAQRDMANLAKTSTISVIFDCILVAIVTYYSPAKENIEHAGGLIPLLLYSSSFSGSSSKTSVTTDIDATDPLPTFYYPLQNESSHDSTIDTHNFVLHQVTHNPTLSPWSLVRPSSTFFIGLGVLSFAFVCQHSSFIIAGSLRHPTKKRWSRVTSIALSCCCILATLMGTFGYLGYLTQCQGNILNNIDSSFSTSSSSLPPTERIEAVDQVSHRHFFSFSPYSWNHSNPYHANAHEVVVHRVANMARLFLCTAMFFVYPMEAFVARHVFVVLFFQGRSAHEGDDSYVLARKDRRIVMTFALYVLALCPALWFDNIGSVLAITGALGGSSLSYVGPGVAYLAIHGDAFLKLVRNYWSTPTIVSSSHPPDWNTLNHERRLKCMMGETTRLLHGPSSTHGSNEPTASSSIAVPNLHSDSHPTDSVFDSLEANSTTDYSCICNSICFCCSDGHRTPNSCFFYLSSWRQRLVDNFLWYFCFIPLWCQVAQYGQEMLKKHKDDEALKSPHPYRFGKVRHHHHQQQQNLSNTTRAMKDKGKIGSFHVLQQNSLLASGEHTPIIHSLSNITTTTTLLSPKKSYVSMANHPLGLISSQLQPSSNVSSSNPKTVQLNITAHGISSCTSCDDDDDIESSPTAMDFFIAIFFIVFGLVAAGAGLFSILL